MKNGIPKSWTKLVGTKQRFSGGLFSGNKSIKPALYDVLDIRWGSASVFDMKKLVCIHPTIQLLLKRKGMPKSRWSRGFPCREIKLKTNN